MRTARFSGSGGGRPAPLGKPLQRQTPPFRGRPPCEQKNMSKNIALPQTLFASGKT